MYVTSHFLSYSYYFRVVIVSSLVRGMGNSWSMIGSEKASENELDVSQSSAVRFKGVASKMGESLSAQLGFETTSWLYSSTGKASVRKTEGPWFESRWSQMAFHFPEYLIIILHI